AAVCARRPFATAHARARERKDGRGIREGGSRKRVPFSRSLRGSRQGPKRRHHPAGDHAESDVRTIDLQSREKTGGPRQRRERRIEERHAPVARTRDDEPLVEVGPMGGEDVLSSCEPAKEGRARVGDEGPHAGDSSREETRIIDGLRSARRGLSGGERVRRSEDRKRREEESEERASDVPEEDAGRMPVVSEESEARS